MKIYVNAQHKEYMKKQISDNKIVVWMFLYFMLVAVFSPYKKEVFTSLYGLVLFTVSSLGVLLLIKDWVQSKERFKQEEIQRNIDYVKNDMGAI